MTADDQPVVVFEGAYQDCAFLCTLLTGSDIKAQIDSSIGMGGGGLRSAGLRRPRLLVRKGDLKSALALVRDFKQNGKMADP
jgi:hypothetical protein